MEDHVLEVANVSKKFRERRGGRGEFYALKNVSLHVDEGEIFALLGPNGAGKTTLLNIIMGLLLPTTGTVRIFGRPPRSPEVSRRLGFVSGEERFHWALTPRDILHFGAMVHHLGRAEEERRTQELVEVFGLQRVMGRRFENLSTGERMRLAFAYALINSPRLVLLDEPTLGLDPHIAIRVREEIKRVNKQFKTTMLPTSHYMHEVEQLADRIAFINGGQILDTGTLADVMKKHPSLESYFVDMVGQEA